MRPAFLDRQQNGLELAQIGFHFGLHADQPQPVLLLRRRAARRGEPYAVRLGNAPHLCLKTRGEQCFGLAGEENTAGPDQVGARRLGLGCLFVRRIGGETRQQLPLPADLGAQLGDMADQRADQPNREKRDDQQQQGQRRQPAQSWRKACTHSRASPAGAPSAAPPPLSRSLMLNRSLSSLLSSTTGDVRPASAKSGDWVSSGTSDAADLAKPVNSTRSPSTRKSVTKALSGSRAVSSSTTRAAGRRPRTRLSIAAIRAVAACADSTP